MISSDVVFLLYLLLHIILYSIILTIMLFFFLLLLLLLLLLFRFVEYSASSVFVERDGTIYFVDLGIGFVERFV